MNVALVNRPAGRLSSPVNRLFDQLLAEAARPAVSPATASCLPPADVVETADAFELALSLPGFQKEAVQINIEKNKLTICGERPRPAVEEGRTWRLAESGFGSFERTFTLPDSVNIGAISARFELGILCVLLPKDAQKTAKLQIEIA